MKKLFVVLLLVSIMMVMAFAKDHLIVGTTDKIRILDPADCYDYFSSNILQNTLAGPVDYEVGTANLKPWIFESWEAASNSTEYTFKVNKDAQFMNGNPIDAEVVKWNLDRSMRLDGQPAFLLTDIIESVEVLDEYTVKITLQRPFSAFVSVLGYTVAFPVDPEETPEDEFFTGIPTASGPYYVADWQRDVRIVLEENPNYFGPKPLTKTIVINFYENASTLRLALESGEIDLAYRELDPRDFLAFKEKGEFAVYEGRSPMIREIVFQCQSENLSDKTVRQALSYAVDRKAIVGDVFAGTAEPLFTLIPGGMWGHKGTMPARNLDKAKALLKEAGYSEDNPLEVDFWYTPSHYGSTEADVAQVLAEAIQETGMVNVNLKYAEWGTYVEYFLNGTMEMFLLGWFPDYLDPDNYMWPFLSEAGAKSMGAYYQNDTITDLMLQAREHSEVLDRTIDYAKIQDMLTEEVPYVPLWQGTQQCVAKPEVQGINLEPTQIFRYYILSLED